MSNQITIGTTVIKTPSKFSISSYNLTEAQRVTSGRMNFDFIAKKKKLFLEYDVITGTALKTILDLIDTNELEFDVTYYDITGVAVTKTFYVGEISTPLHRRSTIGDQHIWKQVAFNFIEL